MGAPYIYDISSLRVKSPCVTFIFKVLEEICIIAYLMQAL